MRVKDEGEERGIRSETIAALTTAKVDVWEMFKSDMGIDKLTNDKMHPGVFFAHPGYNLSEQICAFSIHLSTHLTCG